MKEICAVLAAILGIAFGGVLNRAIYAIPKDIKPGKRQAVCVRCGRAYRWYERSAVSAKLCGHGKCTGCGAVRSTRETVIELLNAGIWVLCLFVLWDRGIAYVLIAMAAVSAYITLAFIDLDTMMIPDRFHVILVLLGALSILVDDTYTPKEHLWGAALGGGFFIICYFLSFVLFKKEGLGWGDVKLMAASGLLLRWKSVFMAILFGAVTASIVLIAISAGSGDRQKEYPFAPFLAAGSVISLLAGDWLLEMYLGLFSFG